MNMTRHMSKEKYVVLSRIEKREKTHLTWESEESPWK